MHTYIYIDIDLYIYICICRKNCTAQISRVSVEKVMQDVYHQQYEFFLHHGLESVVVSSWGNDMSAEMEVVAAYQNSDSGTIHAGVAL